MCDVPSKCYLELVFLVLILLCSSFSHALDPIPFCFLKDIFFNCPLSPTSEPFLRVIPIGI